MMRTILFKKLFFLLLLSCSLISHAAVPEWQLLPENSKLTFTATQNGAPITGQFKTFSAKIFFDFNDLKNSNIDILVDINSLLVTLADIQNTLLSSDWFDAKTFPKAEFKSHDFVKKDDDTFAAKGILTIRNKSVPVTLTFTAKMNTPTHGIFVGKTVIMRSAFGVGQGEWASTNEIKDDVSVNFSVVAQKK